MDGIYMRNLYSDHYESKKYDFIIGYNKLILPEATKVYTPDPLYY